MLPQGQDWAELCRRFRTQRGLKQEAIAQDFHVDQSTVSRWERGAREPSLPMKQAILEDLTHDSKTAPEDPLQLMLESSGSTVALWDRQGILQGCSRRFAKEFSASDESQILHKSAKELTGGSDIMDRALEALEEGGFFEGTVPIATLSFTPFVHFARMAMGGLVTCSILPFTLPSGEIAMLSIYDHDAFATPPEDPQDMFIFWLEEGAPKARSAWVTFHKNG